MAVRFIIDSASDVLPEEAARMGVSVLPLKVVFGSEEYADGVTLTHEQFYNKLVESDVLPTTCQIPPAEFAEAYEAATADGDSVIVITLSSLLSGTYQSAVIAAEDYPCVRVIDSRTVCVGERLLLELGLRLAGEGLDADAIEAALNQRKIDIHLLALLDTLEYLKKGGRISAATALAGSLLSIKPVISVEEGEVRMVGKARGSKQGNNLLRQLVEKTGGIDFSMPFCLAYSGLSDQLLQKYIADSADLWEGQTDRLPIASVGCTIGTHAGPGAIAVCFFGK